MRHPSLVAGFLTGDQTDNHLSPRYTLKCVGIDAETLLLDVIVGCPGNE